MSASPFIDHALLKKLKGDKIVIAADSLTQACYVFTMPDHGIYDKALGNHDFWSKMTAGAGRELAKKTKLDALVRFNHQFGETVSPALTAARRIPDIKADDVRLVYSLFYHMNNPDCAAARPLRTGLEKMFKILELGTPLAQEEVLRPANMHKLLAIAHEMELSHAAAF